MLVIGLSLLTSATALCALYVMRAQQFDQHLTRYRLWSHTLAAGLVDRARVIIKEDEDWRANRSHGTWFTENYDGTMQFEVAVTDPADGDLGDDPTDPVVVTGSVNMGPVLQKVSVRLIPKIEPMPCLNAALFANQHVHVGPGKNLILRGAHAYANDVFTINLSASVEGTILCKTLINLGGTIVGVSVTGVGPLEAPATEVMDDYQALATTIPFSGQLKDNVLAAGRNPWGATNTDGVYYIDTGNQDIELKQFRLHGTLVIRCGAGKTVTLKDAVNLQNFRANYPTLITDGRIKFAIEGTTMDLSESSAGVNFNPVGAPFNGVSDSDQTDFYPNEIRGVVHSYQNIRFEESARVFGAVIAGSGTVEIESDHLLIEYDPAFKTNPPIGYRTVKMEVEAGSWGRDVD
jgi:hypothetical protein